MYRIVLSLISALTLFVSMATHAIDSQSSELQGYGAFSNLNKDWMLMALYGNTSTTDQAFTAQRLEIKIAAKKYMVY